MKRRALKASLTSAVAALLASCAVPIPGLSEGDDGAGTAEESEPDAGAFDPSSVCAEEIDDFETAIWGPILSVKCLGCHNAEGPARASRMVFLTPEAPNYLEHNLVEVQRVASIMAGTRPLLLAMPSDTNPERQHPGGRLLEEGSVEYERLAAFIARLSSPECDTETAAPDCTSPALLGRRLYRLTPIQYDNTVRTLVGLTGEWGRDFPADTVVNGFDNHADELLVSPLLADKLMVAAEGIASQVDLTTLLPCDPASGDTACAREFITEVGERAFRRPLSEDEVSRYLALHAASADFERGSRLVITALLQSPHFLYRRELGTLGADGAYSLSDWEVASELSYLLWDDMPDEELFAAARAGLLRTSEQVTAQAERLLASPRARPVLRRFLFQWLGIGRLATVPKDAQTFPELTDEVRASLLGEAERLVESIVFEGTSRLPELITTPSTFLNGTLAGFYGVSMEGLTTDAAGFAPVTLPEAQRQGVLTLGGVMLVHGRSNASSPVHRGRLVRERFLCQAPPPPPPGINAEPPPFDPSLTVRERYSAHSEEEPCNSCHRLMDPIGFSFEHFDGIGRYRETENGHAIDASGEIVSSPSTDATFEGTGELARLLAESTDVSDCFALQWFRFAAGSTENGRTECALSSLRQEFRAKDLSIRDLVLALTRQQLFTTRSGDPLGEAPEPPVSAPPSPGDARTDAEPPPPQEPPPDAAVVPDTLLVERVVENDYGSGYCHTYRVTNTGDSRLDWSVSLEIDGTMNQNWESNASATTGSVVFTGLSHNASLEPGQFAEFGFCVTR